MSAKKITSSSDGLTLIEVLVSLTILGIILIGIMNFFSQAYSFTNSNQKKTTGINVARNAMMYMEKQSFIEIINNFEKKPSSEIHLMICSDEYKLFWNNDSIDSDCKSISINNVQYNVTFRSNNVGEDNEFIFPLIVKVEWEINKKDYSTELEGMIKSEDIR